jgi:Phycobilisome protein
MKKKIEEIEPVPKLPSKVAAPSLALQWAKKYLQNLNNDFSRVEDNQEMLHLKDVVSQAGREQTAQKLMKSLRTVSHQAWNKVEMLLSQEMERHQIEPSLINPWEITADSFKIYEKTLEVYTKQAPLRQLAMVMRLARQGEPLYQKALEIYTEQVAPSQLATVIGAEVGALRKKYTKEDPRVLGFVSMQFHYTSFLLLQTLSSTERTIIPAYFKVIDDHLYMPLQRAYEAAAEHDFDSPALAAVQNLLPVSTEISRKISHRIIELYPSYRSHSGLLSDPEVKTSSIRDIEMFQVYLWLCTLEGSVAPIQQELFPLCVMLYPTFNVQWELIRQMLHLLDREIQSRLSAKQANTLTPYFQALWHMFSPEVFGELDLQRRSNLLEDNDFMKSLFA